VLPVDWTKQAIQDLIDIVSYIEKRNPSAAYKLSDELTEAAERLPLMPYVFRPGRELGTREYVVHPNYILIYEIKSHAIEILGVLHAKREYPKT
jgi:toxin ParE1/3/4